MIQIKRNKDVDRDIDRLRYTYPNSPPLIADVFSLSKMANAVAATTPTIPHTPNQGDVINNPIKMNSLQRSN